MTASIAQPDRFPIPPDADAFWQFDRVHAPRPLTPLSQDLLLPAFGEGMNAALDEIGYPHRFAMRSVNNFAYLGIISSPAHGEALDKLLAEHTHLAASNSARLASLWQQQWLPSIQPGLERLRAAQYASLKDAELLSVLAELRADLANRWRIHGRVLLVYLAASTFEEFYREHLNPADPTEPYLLLHGFPTMALQSSRGLWRLSRRVAASPLLTSTFQNSPAARLPELLTEKAEGRAFLVELHDYLEIFGWRNDAIFELADPTWREDPERPLAAIQGQLALLDDADPDVHLQRAVRVREELIARARSRLEADPALLARFDALYAQALWYLPIDEDHNFYIDQMGNTGLRLPILELGRRLVRSGAIDDVNDVFFLQLDEFPTGLTGARLRATVADRRAGLQQCASLSPPDTLGAPSRDFVVDPLLAALSKQDTTPLVGPAGTEDVIRGTPAAPGVAHGVARVARSLSEACAVQPGEVLVCEMTLPTWTPLFATIAAVVADTGGVLSHCAIVAREHGIPCVVGTSVGTHAISSGMLISVDGARGTVQIHCRR